VVTVRFFISIFSLVIGFSCYAKMNSISFVSLQAYKKLNHVERVSYADGVRKAFSEFEQKKFSETANTNFLIFLFPIESAYAEDQSKCLIGGAEQPVVAGNKCSTKNNECSGRADSFKCGVIFNSSCIDRVPIGSISERCLKASAGQEISVSDYNEFVGRANSLKAVYCDPSKPTVNSDVVCSKLESRLQEFRAFYEKTADKKALSDPNSTATSLQAIKQNGLCVESNENSSVCVNNSLAVKPWVIPCFGSEKGNPQNRCDDLYLARCVNGHYTEAAQSKEFLEYLKNHKSDVETDYFSRGIEEAIDDVLKRAAVVNPQAPFAISAKKENREKVQKFVTKYNQDQKLCADIDKLNESLQFKKQVEAECLKKSESFKSSKLSFSELSLLGASNQGNLNGVSAACSAGSPLPVKATSIKLLSSSNTVYRTIKIIPLNVVEDKDGSKDLEFIDSTGQFSKIRIFSVSGYAQYKDALGTLHNLDIETIPSCQVTDINDLKAYSKNPECAALSDQNGYIARNSKQNQNSSKTLDLKAAQ
jgi:hypothetical protein